MYRSDHVALAKAVRDAGAEAGMDDEQIRTVATHVAKVAEARTPASATFDPELFMAYAMSPVLTVAPTAKVATAKE